MASPERYFTIDFSGKLVTTVEPMLLKPGDFTVLQNVRYIPNGYGGTSLRGIAGITKINTNAPSTYTNFKTGHHFMTDQPASSHLLIQALNSAGTVGRILDNTTTITGSETGDFSATAIYSLTNVATGRFNSLPDSCVGFCNGYDSVVWGGDEFRIGKLINLDYVGDTFKIDGTDLVTNNLTTEYMSIKSIATEVEGAVTAKLLLHGNATPLVDSGATTHTVTASGAAYSTTEKKFGTWSIHFDGTNDKVTGPAAPHADFNFNGAAWCVDMWVKPDYPAQDSVLCSIIPTGTGDNDYIQLSLEYTASPYSLYPKISMFVDGGEVCGAGSGLVSTVSIPYSVISGNIAYNWIHLTFCQNGTSFYIFQNGALTATCTDDAGDKMPDGSASFVIGADKAGTGSFFGGYIDELAIWKSAKYITTFTPPALPYGAEASYETLASMYVASPRPLSGVKFYIDTANDAASVLYDVKEWNGSDWVSCTTKVDGTAITAGTISLGQTGTISWDSTVTTSKPTMIYNIHAYWYLIQFLGLNNTTYPTIYYATVKAPMQGFTDIWDGVKKYPSAVFRYDASNSDYYQDRTTEVLEVDWISGTTKATAMKINGFKAGDAIYVGSPFRLQGINVIFVSEDTTEKYTNTKATTLSCSYWNGSDWFNVAGFVDGTKGGENNNVAFHHGGMVTWTSPPVGYEYQRTIENDFPFYYYKFEFSDVTDATVWVDQISVIPAPKVIHPVKYCFSWQQRTVLINEYSGYQDKVIVSIPYSTSTFNGDNSFETRVDDSLMCGVSVHTRYDNSNLEEAVICSKTKTYLLTGDTTKTFKFVKLSDVYGCINPNTMRQCVLSTENGRREVAIWLSQVGVVMYDGASIKRIDDDIRDKWTPNHANVIADDSLLTMYANFDERQNEYWLMYPNSTNSHAWVYNVDFNKWWFYSMPPATGVLQGCFPQYAWGTITDGTNDETKKKGYQYMVAFSSTGFLYHMNNGTSSDTGTITRTITTGDSPLIKSQEMLYYPTEMEHICLYLKANATADNATLTHYGDGYTTPTTLQTFLQAHTDYNYREIRAAASNTVSKHHILHKFSISHTGDDVAIGLEPMLMTVDYRVSNFKGEE